MPVWIIASVQWLHVTAGVLWIGTAVALDVVVWPIVLRMPAAQGRALLESVVHAITPVSGAAGVVTIILGIIRGTVLGPITSFGFLFGQAYGITWIVALALTLFVVVTGVAWYARADQVVWDGNGVRPGGARRVHLQSALELGCFALVLACMILMAFGY